MYKLSRSIKKKLKSNISFELFFPHFYAIKTLITSFTAHFIINGCANENIFELHFKEFLSQFIIHFSALYEQSLLYKCTQYYSQLTFHTLNSKRDFSKENELATNGNA